MQRELLRKWQAVKKKQALDAAARSYHVASLAWPERDTEHRKARHQWRRDFRHEKITAESNHE